jgi:uncharacterized protein YdhG (YjbR/CyaY superfamily)
MGSDMNVKTSRRGPRTIDEYLARLPSEKRAVLEKLRRAIVSVVPEAEECISYQVPAFRLHGRMLVAFGAAARHCAFYPGAHTIEKHASALASYDTSKGTIRFQPDRPLPDALVQGFVRARLEKKASRRPRRSPDLARATPVQAARRTGANRRR